MQKHEIIKFCQHGLQKKTNPKDKNPHTSVSLTPSVTYCPWKELQVFRFFGNKALTHKQTMGQLLPSLLTPLQNWQAEGLKPDSTSVLFFLFYLEKVNWQILLNTHRLKVPCTEVFTTGKQQQLPFLADPFLTRQPELRAQATKTKITQRIMKFSFLITSKSILKICTLASDKSKKFTL